MTQIWIKDFNTLDQLVNGSKEYIFCRNKAGGPLIWILIQGNSLCLSDSFIYSFSSHWALLYARYCVSPHYSQLIWECVWAPECARAHTPPLERSPLYFFEQWIPKFVTYLIPQGFHIHPIFNIVLGYSMWETWTIPSRTLQFSWSSKDSWQVEKT